jgi:hypothetical protein
VSVAPNLSRLGSPPAHPPEVGVGDLVPQGAVAQLVHLVLHLAGSVGRQRPPARVGLVQYPQEEPIVLLLEGDLEPGEEPGTAGP